jgi:hypothetical protein
MGTDNKEVAWILLDEDTKPIRISFDNEPTYVVENDTNYTMNIQPLLHSLRFSKFAHQK